MTNRNAKAINARFALDCATTYIRDASGDMHTRIDYDAQRAAIAYRSAKQARTISRAMRSIRNAVLNAMAND